MIVLSLFDGMSCARLALDKAGHKVTKYYASEIDKHAIKVTMSNYPDTIQLGDVTKWREWDINFSTIDLLCAGSPCQGFSFAGKQLAFDDPRSALFFVFVEIWQHIKTLNPNAKYLLENVKMKAEHELVISRYLNINPIEINSALLSAQNRVRLYWTNIYNKPHGMFGDLECAIPQPQDKGILLRDILEKDVDEKYYLSLSAVNRISHYNNADKSFYNENKSLCLVSGYSKLGRDNTYILASRGRGDQNTQQLEPRNDGKTNCLTSVQKDNLVMQINDNKRVGGISINERGIRPHRGDDKKTGISELGTILYDNQKTDTHLTNHVQKFITGSRIRRLTPTECERLQTVPDGYTSHVSDTQRYRMLGNGWTVDVIAHIFKYL